MFKSVGTTSGQVVVGHHGTQFFAYSVSAFQARYASHLLEKQKKLEAVQLYRKANRNTEAAQILVDIAKSPQCR